jgi:hypothetical protein
MRRSGATCILDVVRRESLRGKPRTSEHYLSDEEIAENLLFSAEPSPLTAATITIESPAAMMAYSIEVAPDSHRKNFSSLVMVRPRRATFGNVVGKNCRTINTGTEIRGINVHIPQD